jgi:uncharacterized protein YbaR (Trm112 family)
MREDLLDLLRCPFCGTRLSLVENSALVRADGLIESGVLGCECCAFPIVAGIPVMLADEATRGAMHDLEDGKGERALTTLLELDEPRAAAFKALFSGGQATYRDALAILSLDAEGTCFLYRFSDPTYVMAQAMLEALVQHEWIVAGRVLDLCGGSGHLTRTLAATRPAEGVVLADSAFWKLWLASRFTSPFPYIWHKRLLAEEMMRLTGPDGVVVMPHLHSALGENFSAGDTLSPASYRDLFAPHQPRLFSDATLLTQVLERNALDLSDDRSPEELGSEPSFTLIASQRTDLFRPHALALPRGVAGELRVNPLYHVEYVNGTSVLTLVFPTPEYEEEFAECKRYLPATVTVAADLTSPIVPAALGPECERLVQLRVLIDAPPRYY